MRYKLESATTLSPQTIALKFAGGAWARITFTEEPKGSWHVQINSDWGHWNYRWGQENIYKFMSTTGRNYFHDKFTATEQRLPDLEATKTRLRKAVREHFNDNYWSNKEEWQEAMRVIGDLDFESFEGFMHQDIPEFLDVERWNYYCDGARPASTFFFKKIFPKFSRHIRKLSREYDKKHKLKKPEKTKAEKLKGVKPCAIRPSQVL